MVVLVGVWLAQADTSGLSALTTGAAAGWMAAGISVAALCGVSLLFLTVPDRLVGLFLTEPDAAALAVPCLLVAAAAQPVMAVTDVLAGSLRGAGDTRTPMAVALAGPVVVRLTACWVLAFELEGRERADAQRLLIEAGLLVAFVLDGGCAPLEEAHREFKRALALDRLRPSHVEALVEGLLEHEAEPRQAITTK